MITDKGTKCIQTKQYQTVHTAVHVSEAKAYALQHKIVGFWEILSLDKYFTPEYFPKHSILCNVANLLNLAQTDTLVLLQAHQHTDTKHLFHNMEQSNI